MHPNIEIESTRSALLATGEHFWGWEIPVYLFLGGLVAGLMIAVSAILLARGKERVTEAMKLGLVGAPVLLLLGMGALLFDLTLKLHVVRFYMTFRPTAPMSWGSWILVLVFPAQALLVLALPTRWLEGRLSAVKKLDRLRAWSLRHLTKLAWVGLLGGVALGIYTGILLSTTVAHPLWSSGALGLLFLVSGGSTGAAALMLAERDEASQGLLARIDIGLIALEAVVMGLWLAGLLTQGPLYRQAAGLVLWGPYAPVFVGFVVFGGLLVPAALEALALRGKAMHSWAVPALVLIGGLILRFVIVYAGQDVSFVRG